MAYEVTATRRRPKSFDEMAGQEFVVSTLKRSIETGKIAHAYLFSGPRGCGKTSAARILARSLNCAKGPTAAPCGECPACLEIARGSSLDVIEIDGASNTSVNDVRQIKDEVQFPPNGSRYKVYIIDEVHMLSNSAFNALLKTIEEPPPYIIFVFATTELHKVPATIKSRCQQFAFRLFPVELIKSLLADTCRELGLEAEDEALLWIAKEATGSLRDAYTLFDQVAAFSDGAIRTGLIQEKLGLVGLDAVTDLVDACVAGRTDAALAAVDATLERGVAVEQFVVDLAEYFRGLLLIKSGLGKETLLGFAPERFSQAALAALSIEQLEHGVSDLLSVYRDIRYSVSPRFDLEAAAARLCYLARWVSPAELRAAIDGVRGSLLVPPGGARDGPGSDGRVGEARPADAGAGAGADGRAVGAAPAGAGSVGGAALGSPGAALGGAGAAPAGAGSVGEAALGSAGLALGSLGAAPAGGKVDLGEADLTKPGAFTAAFKKMISGKIEPAGAMAAVPDAAGPIGSSPPVATSVAPPVAPSPEPRATAPIAPAPPMAPMATAGGQSLNRISGDDDNGDAGFGMAVNEREDDGEFEDDDAPLWATRSEALAAAGQARSPGVAAAAAAAGPETADTDGAESDSSEAAAAVDSSAAGESLRRAMVAALKKEERGILASGLEKAAGWRTEDGTITVVAADRLTAEILRKDLAAIAAAATAADAKAGGGRKWRIVIEEATPAATADPAKAAPPPAVETVRRLFRGTIVKLA
jgi:DNA polymerase-3 subunit gamma/tau